MRRLLEEQLARPFKALLSGLELLNREVEGAQRIDGMLSRVVHTLSRPRPDQGEHPPSAPAREDEGTPDKEAA